VERPRIDRLAAEGASPEYGAPDPDEMQRVGRTRHLFGWKLLAPCLVLSVLAFGAATFYAGWTMAQDAFATSHTAHSLPAATETVSARPSHEDRKSADNDSARVIDRGAATMPTTSRDRTHEVVAYPNPYMRGDGAYPIGVSPDHEHANCTVEVTKRTLDDGNVEVVVTHSTGYGFGETRLRFLPKEKRIEASIGSAGDTEPQPPPAWSDVNGRVWLSSWDWTRPGPMFVQYDLHGIRGGEWCCAHEKIVLAR
jgi:hypothetical protein